MEKTSSITTTVNMKNVVTFDGSVALRKECRKIGDFFYKIGDRFIKDSGQCYNIDGTYYTAVKTNSKIAWDHAQNQYNLINTMIKGIVNKDLEIGYFTLDYCHFVLITMAGDSLLAKDLSCVPKGYIYDFSTGNYKPKETVRYTTPQHLPYKPTRKFLKTDLYGFGEDPMFEQVVASATKYKDNIKPSVFDKYLPFKYGLEIETDFGYLPENVYFKYGAFPLKDGSIHGEECTTIPYSGDKIVNTIGDLCNELSICTGATYNNSVHINIGSIPVTPENRASIWLLYCRLQGEIEQFIPPYKRTQEYMREKRNAGKDHCKYLPSLGLMKRYSISNSTQFRSEILDADSQIRKFLNDGNNSMRYVRESSPKWEQVSRYYAVNMLPMYFSRSESQARVEFRIHSGTVSPIKIINWVFITNAIVKYALEKQDVIFGGKEKILLEDVIDYAYNDQTNHGQWLTRYLNGYIRSRVFEHIATVQEHSTYGNEFNNDSKYIFNVNGENILTYANKRT